MESNVWTQWFVQAVNSVLNRFASSSNPIKQSNGIESANAPATAAASTSISSSVTNLEVIRDPKKATMDALFGVMKYNDEFVGYTMERTAVAIPAGSYRGYKRDSAHFGMRVVGIDVPNRTDIECHPANIPAQLNGCIAIGSEIDNDALDSSRLAFNKMMLAVPEDFTVIVKSL